MLFKSIKALFGMKIMNDTTKKAWKAKATHIHWINRLFFWYWITILISLIPPTGRKTLCTYSLTLKSSYWQAKRQLHAYSLMKLVAIELGSFSVWYSAIQWSTNWTNLGRLKQRGLRIQLRSEHGFELSFWKLKQSPKGTLLKLRKTEWNEDLTW